MIFNLQLLDSLFQISLLLQILDVGLQSLQKFDYHGLSFLFYRFDYGNKLLH